MTARWTADFLNWNFSYLYKNGMGHFYFLVKHYDKVSYLYILYMYWKKHKTCSIHSSIWQNACRQNILESNVCQPSNYVSNSKENPQLTFNFYAMLWQDNIEIENMQELYKCLSQRMYNNHQNVNLVQRHYFISFYNQNFFR